MRKLETDAFKKKRNEINELNNLVKTYSERIEEDIVHLKLTGPTITRHDAERAIDTLEEKTKYLPLKRDLAVVVDSENADLLDFPKRVKESVRKQLIPLLCYVDLDLRRLFRVSVALMVFGVIAMGTASLLTELSFNPYALHETLVIASWVFIWAGVETFFFDRRKLKNRKHHLHRIYFAEFMSTNNK